MRARCIVAILLRWNGVSSSVTIRGAKILPKNKITTLTQDLVLNSLILHSMAAAAPQTLTSDSLEVTRSSHLISNRNPTPATLKALSASSLLLAARAEKKAARIARGNKASMEFTGAEDLGGDASEEDEEMGVAEALLGADMALDDEDVEEEEQISVKVRSSLRKTGGVSMGMK